MSLFEFLKDHPALVLIVGGLIFIVVGLGSAIFVAMSTQGEPGPEATPLPIASATIAPTPASTPEPTPKPVIMVAPQPWHGEDYDQYIRDLEAFYNITETPKENRTFPDPLHYKTAQILMNYSSSNTASHNPGYVEGHPETANGSLIFLPTPKPTPPPIPTPTPNPFSMEKHTKLLDVDQQYIPAPDHTGTTAGILAYDPGHSHGIYPYYYQGDITAIQLHFVNDQYKEAIDKERIELTIQKQVLGQYVTVISNSYDYTRHIAPASVDQYYGTTDKTKLPGFTTDVISFEIPRSFNFGGAAIDTRGSYILTVTVYVDGIQACKISQDLAIL